MDLTAQLKNNLISRIKDSKDLNFLKALQTIFDSSEQALFDITAAQQDSVEKGRTQIASGEFKNHGEVMSEMRTWLKK